MNLREKISEAAFWHEAICLRCGTSDDSAVMVEASCLCPEGAEVIVDAIEFTEILSSLDAEGTVDL